MMQYAIKRLDGFLWSEEEQRWVGQGESWFTAGKNTALSTHRGFPGRVSAYLGQLELKKAEIPHAVYFVGERELIPTRIIYQTELV